MADENIGGAGDLGSGQTPGGQQTAGQSTGSIGPETTTIETNKDARLWGSLCHLAGVAGLVMPFLGNIIGPLVLWMIKKDEFTFVREQGKEAVNFQISMSIYMAASLLTLLCGIGFVIAPAVGLFDLIMLIIATVKSNEGVAYRYPLTIRFIK
jgi:uncharacterized protein